MFGYLVRKRYRQKIAAIKFIQSYFRTTWTRKLFIHLRQQRKIIEKHMSKYMMRRNIRKFRMKEYKNHLDKFDEIRKSAIKHNLTEEGQFKNLANIN